MVSASAKPTAKQKSGRVHIHGGHVQTVVADVDVDVDVDVDGDGDGDESVWQDFARAEPGAPVPANDADSFDVEKVGDQDMPARARGSDRSAGTRGSFSH